MEITVESLGGVQFEIKARQHSVICDQPVENDGYDEGMTPPEFLLSSLGSCAAYYAVDYLKRANLEREGVKVRTTSISRLRYQARSSRIIGRGLKTRYTGASFTTRC